MSTNPLQPVSPPASSGALQPGTVDIHPALQEVRRMDEFQPQMPGNTVEDALTEWLAKLGNWFNDWVNGLLESIKHLFPETETLPKIDAATPLMLTMKYVLLTLGVALILVLLLVLIRYGREWWANRQPKPAPLPRIVDGEALDTAKKHYAEATALAKQNQYEAAIRQLYLASLCLMDETGTLPFEAGRTNLETLWRIRELSKLGTKDRERLAEEFWPLARQFEAIRFGNRSTNAEGFARCETLYTQMNQQLCRQKTLPLSRNEGNPHE